MKKKLLLFLIISSAYVSSAYVFFEHDFFKERRRDSEANQVYERSLKNRCLARYSDCHSLPWSLYLLRRENIDSATAVFIAIKAAEEYRGDGAYSEMIPLAARLMGDNKEHWMIYIIPKRILRNLHKDHWLNFCDEVRVQRYNRGKLFVPGVTREEIYCPRAIRVIISKENGEVLFIQ